MNNAQTNTTNNTVNTTNTVSNNTTNLTSNNTTVSNNTTTSGPTTENITKIPNAGYTKSKLLNVCYILLVVTVLALYKFHKKCKEL